MSTGIPQDELRYWSLVVFKDEKGELLFDIQHDSELNWQLPDFKSINMDDVFGKMN
jgi:hypothetical protein